MLSDLRSGLNRALRIVTRKPGFGAAVSLTLALGIGVATSLYLVVSSVLFQPLSYYRSERLVVMMEKGPAGSGITPENFEVWAQSNRSFELMAPCVYQRGLLTGLDDPVEVRSARVSSTFFHVFGIRPLLGEASTRWDDPNVVVLSEAFWNRHYGRSPNVLGTALRFRESAYTVVGVVSPGSAFPGVDLWLPLSIPEGQRRTRIQAVAYGRLREDVSSAAAQAELDSLSENKQEQVSSSWRIEVSSLHETIVQHSRDTLYLLLGAAFLVFLLAFANSVILELTNSEASRRELATRMAIGASRFQLWKQMLAERLVLTVFGGILGLFLAHWGMQALRVYLPVGVPRRAEVQWNPETLFLVFVLVIFVAVVLSLVCIFCAPVSNLRLALNEGPVMRPLARSVVLSDILVAAQFALALVLAVSTGFLLSSLLRLAYADFGFQPEKAILLELHLPASRYSAGPAMAARVQEIEEQLSQLPWVTSVGSVSNSGWITKPPACPV